MHRAWVYKLKARYEAEGGPHWNRDPGARRPLPAHPAPALEPIVRIRKELTGQGLEAGPDTIRWHLEHHHGIRMARATVARPQTSSAPAPNWRSWRRIASV